VQLALAERPAATATRRTAPHIPELRIEAKRELVEVILQMLVADPSVVCVEEPAFQQGNHEEGTFVRDRHAMAPSS